jgi:hypothetical protein
MNCWLFCGGELVGGSKEVGVTALARQDLFDEENPTWTFKPAT